MAFIITVKNRQNIMTLSISTFSITALNVMTFSITSNRITTLRISAFRITVKKFDTQYYGIKFNATQHRYIANYYDDN